jgi:hypothetical protein
MVERGVAVVRMQVQLTEAQVAAVRRAAEKQGVSQAEVIRRALDAFIARPPATDRAALRERARTAIGAFHGGPSDVSLRHDYYLAESAYDWVDDE